MGDDLVLGAKIPHKLVPSLVGVLEPWTDDLLRFHQRKNLLSLLKFIFYLDLDLNN